MQKSTFAFQRNSGLQQELRFAGFVPNHIAKCKTPLPQRLAEFWAADGIARTALHVRQQLLDIGRVLDKTGERMARRNHRVDQHLASGREYSHCTHFRMTHLVFEQMPARTFRILRDVYPLQQLAQRFQTIAEVVKKGL